VLEAAPTEGAGVADAATDGLAAIDPSVDGAAAVVAFGMPDPDGAPLPAEQAAMITTAIDATVASRRDTRSSSERDLFRRRVRRCPVRRRRAMVVR
jgi:hypothetical protein